MNFLLSTLVYIPAILIGFLLIHLIWRDDDLSSIFIKFFTGIGAGLGISSFLYFATLLIAPSKIPFIVIQLIFLFIVLTLNVFYKRFPANKFRLPKIQLSFSTVLLSFFLIITLASFINHSMRRDQGAFDAWMIYNRAARFIYRDTTNWQATLSPELYWGFHADYPLLLSLNVASAWELLRNENLRAPLIQGGLFLIASLGLTYTTLAKAKGKILATLATIILMANSGLIYSSAGQTADVHSLFLCWQVLLCFA